VIASELADKTNGQAGTLGIDPASPCDANSAPNTMTLTPKGIDYPGNYEGTLRIIIPGNVQNEVIPVSARLRDNLMWPALVIFLGALFIGWAIRHALGDTDKNVTFQTHLLNQTQDRYKNISERINNPALENILKWLGDAQLAQRSN